MSLRVRFEKKSGYLIAKFSGSTTAPEIGSRLRSVAERCRKENFNKIVIDISKIPLAPTFGEKFQFGEKGAVFAEFGIKVAMVAAAKTLEPGRLAELVARNRGVNVSGFTEMAAAVEWLLK